MEAAMRNGALIKRLFVVRNKFYRRFCICKINFSPRGVTISERMMNKQSHNNNRLRYDEHLDKETNSEVLDSPSVGIAEFHEVHKDTGSHKKSSATDNRSIDSVDPVILKYVKVLENLRGEMPQEKVYSTNFGTVRFDNENVPQIHGQFDIVDGPDKSALVDQAMKNNDIKFNSQIDEVQRQPNSESSSNTFAEDLEVKSEPEKVTKSEENRAMIESERVFEELFGDDGYMPSITSSTMSNLTFNSDNPTNSVPVAAGYEEKSTSALHDSQSGFIDEHFFGNNTLQNKANVNFDRTNAEFNHVYPNNASYYRQEYNGLLPASKDIGSTNDMNFIDETYFKNSLDTIKENRKPSVDFSEIKEELETAFSKMSVAEVNPSQANEKNSTELQCNFTPEHNSKNIALRYLGIDDELKSLSDLDHQQTKERKTIPPVKEPPPKTAYEYIIKKRREIHDSQFGLGDMPKPDVESPTSKGYEKILSLINEKTKYSYTKAEMLSMLKGSIIYDKNDIVGLYKPYGVAMHEGTSNAYHVLQHYLPDLAAHLKAEQLHMIHRLDAKTTGVLILARTSSMASTLKDMFKEQLIKKTYWTITKGIPSPLQGTIDIPIAEGTVDGKRRMVLRPDIDGYRGVTSKCHKAVTDFYVLGKNVNCAWVEVNPRTGVKHQVRVHLGLGLSCPILGDHKYSHLKKLAPQKLPGDMLDRLKIPQSKVRNLPIYLHSRSILIPEIANGRNVSIQARIPAFFNKTLSRMKLNTTKNKVRYDGSRCIDE